MVGAFVFWVVFAFPFVGVVCLSWGGRSRQQRALADCLAAAERFELVSVEPRRRGPFIDGPARYEGRIDGIPVVLAPAFSRTQLGTRGYIHDIRYYISLEPVGPPMKLLFPTAGIGKPPFQTGDAEFDKATFVRTNQPEELRQFLTPERRATVLKCRSAWYAELTESHIELRSSIRDKDPDAIANNILFAVDAAKDWQQSASEVRAA